MRQPLLSPDKFASWFNQVVPGAHRRITAQDTRDLTAAGLIGKYGYLGRADFETVRGVLQYEEMRQARLARSKVQPACKMCGRPLSETHDKRGRPKEYCSDCEPFRVRERYKKWERKKELEELNSNYK
jgi:hypothetical protein